MQPERCQVCCQYPCVCEPPEETSEGLGKCSLLVVVVMFLAALAVAWRHHWL